MASLKPMTIAPGTLTSIVGAILRPVLNAPRDPKLVVEEFLASLPSSKPTQRQWIKELEQQAQRHIGLIVALQARLWQYENQQ